ncbi:MAG: hypothetical protein M1588_01735 [Planctomycetes bacterium]|jgi:hypothetical protein|nr:hypothetical protein [Planctomycetota bacterium]
MVSSDPSRGGGKERGFPPYGSINPSEILESPPALSATNADGSAVTSVSFRSTDGPLRHGMERVVRLNEQAAGGVCCPSEIYLG